MKGVKAILLMAGQGLRFGGTIFKQFHSLADMPIYQRTLDRLKSSQLFEEILMVVPLNMVEELRDAHPDHQVIAGGSTRQASSYHGLIHCGSETEIVLIHDGVRPFVTERILFDNIEGARKFGAVDTCIPSPDTIVYSPNGASIDSIPERNHYLLGQTPQTFHYPLIHEAHEKTRKTDATDDCQLVHDLGHPVHIVRGELSNFKITNPEDLKLAELQH